jgi:predicted nucleic acid-binding Zn ribbon protein
VFKIINSNKRSEKSSRRVCSADLEDSLGKEQLYRRKIKKIMFEIIIVAIMKLSLFNFIGS